VKQSVKQSKEENSLEIAKNGLTISKLGTEIRVCVLLSQKLESNYK